MRVPFGPVLVEVVGTDPTARAVSLQLGAARDPQCDDRMSADLILEIGRGLRTSTYRPRWFSAKGKLHFDAGSYFCDYPLYFRYLASGVLGSGPIHARVDTGKTSLRKRLRSLVSRRTDFEASLILSYTLAWHLLHLALLRKDAAFMHGSAFATVHGATLIAGTGGCGKTSTLFKALENESRRYLGEDFIILDAEGRVHYNPKPVAVYASDAEFTDGILRSYLAMKRSSGERLGWFLHRKLLRRNPTLRIPPPALTGGRIAAEASLRHAVYMIRGELPAFAVRTVSAEEFCERALDASMRELKTLHELLCLIRANAPLEMAVPAFQSVVEDTRRIYLAALRHVEPLVAEVPHRMKPDEVVFHLEREKLV